jgi:hypothetical protein
MTTEHFSTLHAALTQKSSPLPHTKPHNSTHKIKPGTELNPVQVTLSDENFTLTMISRKLKIKPKNIILNAILKITPYYNYVRF